MNRRELVTQATATLDYARARRALHRIAGFLSGFAGAGLLADSAPAHGVLENASARSVLDRGSRRVDAGRNFRGAGTKPIDCVECAIHFRRAWRRNTNCS